MENKIEQVQGDEEIIEKLYSYLVATFSRLTFKVKVPLKDLFPEPDSKWLKSFWSNNSHADIAVFRHGELVCIIEPGGWFHAKDKRQKTRDSKKDKICWSNGVNCLRFFNDTVEQHLEKKITKRLLRKYFYGCGSVSYGMARSGVLRWG